MIYERKMRTTKNHVKNKSKRWIKKVIRKRRRGESFPGHSRRNCWSQRAGTENQTLVGEMR